MRKIAVQVTFPVVSGQAIYRLGHELRSMLPRHVLRGLVLRVDWKGPAWQFVILVCAEAFDWRLRIEQAVRRLGHLPVIALVEA